jgi:hypothetical protein
MGKNFRAKITNFLNENPFRLALAIFIIVFLFLPLVESNLSLILKIFYNDLSDCVRFSQDAIILITCPIVAFFIVRNFSQRSKKISFFITAFLSVVALIITFTRFSFVGEDFDEIVFNSVYQGWCIIFFTILLRKEKKFIFISKILLLSVPALAVLLYSIIFSFFAVAGCSYYEKKAEPGLAFYTSNLSSGYICRARSAAVGGLGTDSYSAKLLTRLKYLPFIEHEEFKLYREHFFRKDLDQVCIKAEKEYFEQKSLNP